MTNQEYDHLTSFIGSVSKDYENDKKSMKYESNLLLLNSRQDEMQNLSSKTLLYEKNTRKSDAELLTMPRLKKQSSLDIELELYLDGLP